MGGRLMEQQHQEKVTRVVWAQGVDPKYCASSSLDGTVSIWDTDLARRTFHHVLHQGSGVVDVGWRRGDNLLASAGVKPTSTPDNIRSGSVQVWRPTCHVIG